MKKVILATVVLVVAGAATAQAGVDFNVNIGVPVPMGPPPAVVTAYPAPTRVVVEAPPQFIYSPDLGFYVSVGTPYDMVYMDNGYYLYRGGYWYFSPSYGGPWYVPPGRRLPPGLRRYRYDQIRHFRDREYRVYMHDREHYRGNWYRPADVRPGERRDRWEERRDDHRDDHRSREERGDRWDGRR